MATPDLLIQPPVWRGVARRLAQWHAVLPTNESTTTDSTESPPVTNGAKVNGHTPTSDDVDKDDITPIVSAESGPSLWTVLQKWIIALPVATIEQRARRKMLQKELEHIKEELDINSSVSEKGVRI